MCLVHTLLYCQDTERYDVRRFPPRCLRCPRVKSVPMNLTMLPANSRSMNESVKFSPGLPQNDTCGCWAGSHQMLEVVLNESRIVVGLFLEQTTHRTWLSDVAVWASDDNTTFLDWGNYSASNFTEASTILFPLPVRARIFRIVVYNYINHYINHTSFPFSAQAFVSEAEPFACGCPILSSGECCPRQNMRVWEDQCFSCMDNSSLNVMMVDECGICKPGTVERWGQCVAKANQSEQGGFSFEVGTVLTSFPELFNVVNDSRRWTVQLQISSAHAVHSIFLIDQPVVDHPCTLTPSFCCLVPYYQTHTVLLPFPDGTFNASTLPCESAVSQLSSNSDHQFQQYDRGRYSVTMSARGIWNWASCVKSSTCTGFIGVLFAQPFPGAQRFLSHVVYRPVEFEFVAPPFMVTTVVPPPPPAVGFDFHRRALDGSLYAKVSGVQFQSNVTVRWDYADGGQLPIRGGILELPYETSNWTMLRMEGRTVQGTEMLYAAPRPQAMVMHDAVSKISSAMVTARAVYGLNLSDTPIPGDSERVVTLLVTSQQVRRLKRLVARFGTNFTVFTNSKGSITYPEYVMDMGVECNDNARRALLLPWLERHTELFGAQTQFTAFINRVCTLALDLRNRVFWIVPMLREPFQRNQAISFEIQADFG